MSADRTKPDREDTRRPGISEADGRAKKPYRSPKLTAYGSIQDLTNTITTGSKNDGGGGTMNMMA